MPKLSLYEGGLLTTWWKLLESMEHLPINHVIDIRSLSPSIFQMAVGGKELPTLLAGTLWMLWMSPLTCFNLEPRAAEVYHYPYSGSQGRESYFGFSVALYHNSKNNTNWWVLTTSDTLFMEDGERCGNSLCCEPSEFRIIS